MSKKKQHNVNFSIETENGYKNELDSAEQPLNVLPVPSRGMKGIQSKIHFKFGDVNTKREAVDNFEFEIPELTGDTPGISNTERHNEWDSKQLLQKHLDTTLKGFMPKTTKRSCELALPGRQIRNEIQQIPLLIDEYPKTMLTKNGYRKRLEFEELKKTRLEELCQWKQKDIKGMKKNAYLKEVQRKNENILSVATKNEIEQLEVMKDNYPCLEVRKILTKFIIYVKMLCKYIIETSIFDNFTTMVILVNSVMMMLNNPTDTAPDPIFEEAETVFLILYTGEMVLKIVGMGFIFGEGVYLKDSFNILDFIIVMSSLIALGDKPPETTGGGLDDEEQGFSMASLRAFRVLRPLRTISSIKGLKVLIVALISALPLLGDTLTILAGFFLTFSIAGSQILSGVLKNRCFSIQTGVKLGEESDSLCSVQADCPGGYFCGKGNQNPNNGATNFDNVLYSFLAVFQTTTLEGWSDVQVMVEKSYSRVCFIYFTLIVFGGAFFMLNLTLAVINSKFSEAHSAHLASEANNGQLELNGDISDSELDNALLHKDAMTISQFITARIYAKKMVQFLRKRQELKRQQLERMQRIKEKQIMCEISSKQQSGELIAISNQQQQFNFKQNTISPISPDQSIQNIPIFEEDEDNQQEYSEPDELEKDIQDFYKNCKIQMQRQGQVDLPKIAKRITDPLKKNNTLLGMKPQSKAPVDGKLGLKGNIGLQKLINVEPSSKADYQQKMFGIMAQECDIDLIIPKGAQQNNKLDKTQLKIVSNEGSFNLSLELDELDNDHNYSQNNEDTVVIGPTQVKRRNNRRIPGLNYDKLEKSEDSGLITSDSEFEKAAKEAGYLKSDNNKLRKTSVDPINGNTFNISKDISKTFKRMLSSNHKRILSANENEYCNDMATTQGSHLYRQDIDRQTQFSEIETKYKKNMVKAIDKKKFKEDQELEEEYLHKPPEKKYEEDPNETPFDQTRKDQVNKLQECISVKIPDDPFKDLNHLTSKIDITKDCPYQGTSQHDVLQQRITNHTKQETLDTFKFLKVNKYVEENPQREKEIVRQAPIRSMFDPFQQKTFYEVHEDSSEIDEGTQSTDEDKLFAAEQPFYTSTNVGYYKMLKQCKLPEMMKRSDIMITSTLSMSIFPKDQRVMINQYFAKMTQDELIEYLDEKNAFNALMKEHEYQIGKVRDKDKEFKENYMKCFIHRSNFMSKTLSEFKARVKKLNTNKVDKIVKPKELVKIEQFRHQQLKKASEKRGPQRFDMETGIRLLEGKYHEEDEDEDDQEDKGPLNKSIFVKDVEDLEAKNRYEQFEAALHKIFDEEQLANRFKCEDEIPSDIKHQFGLPQKMGMYEVDFNKIREYDVSFKKQRPLWSGQDVLRDKLDNEKSLWVVRHLNFIRVWPDGPYNYYKRWRYYLRKMVKHSMFDNLMTLFVLLNTIVLAADHYGMSQAFSDMLDFMNSIFTWIFIFELLAKLLAVGINKYIADKMNYLDGGVVSLSIFELVMEEVLAGAEGGVNLSAFKTLRMLRTFRVFRIARLLKALKSMQVIMGVILRSYMSFFYIANLMFLFIIIFSLLGTQLFGGKFGDDPDTIPRGNFDSFSIAFITVFQILTMENWQSVLFDSFKSGEKFANSIYCIVWIFLGNFILLNLFLAILLDSFLEEDEEEPDEAEIAYLLEQKKKRKQIKDKRMAVNKVQMGENNEKKLAKLRNQPSKLYFAQKPESEEDLEDLDEEQIVAIFKEEGVIKKEKSEIQQEKLYETKEGKIECESAFYIFAKQNNFRIFCYKSINSPLWDNTVMVLIGLSSLKLAYDAYLQESPKDDPAVLQSEFIDKIFNYLFIIEMTFKLIALGFIMDEGSYLRDTWNQLDYFIVMASVVDMAFSSYDLAAVKIMRMLRVLRPLRMIAHNPELKMIINALLNSLGSIMNVLIVIAVVYLIFAIIGVNLFKGKFFYCTLDTFKIHTAQECEIHSGLWTKYDFNFDNAIDAMETLYVVSSLEGWPDIMIQTIDMVDENVGPLKEYSKGMYWYYIIFIFIGSFFFLNFFIGVLFLKFNQAQKEDRKGFTDKDLGWMDVQKLILTAEPDYETTNVPSNKYIKEFHDLVSSPDFEKFIMTCIVLNIVQMALNAENMSPLKTTILDVSGHIFTVIFLVEMILKLVAYRKTYFKNSWNQFDFVVVNSSLFDIFMQLLENIDADLSVLSSLTQLARIARILRVTRILKLAGKDEGLQAILQTVQFSIPSLANVGILLMLIYFMFAVLGNFLFFPVKTGDVIDPVHKNFDGFMNSFLMVFALSTGEDWNKVMYDCNRTPDSVPACVEGQNCGNGTAIGYWYFFLIVLICSHVMLNLFILVIIQQFEHYYLPKDNIISHFKTDLGSFLKVWRVYTQDRYQCKKIKENMLTDFFRELGEYGNKDESLGFSHEHYDTGEMKKQVLKMGIKSDQGFIYFNELLYRCMRRKFGTMKINKKMQIFELKNQLKIYEMGKAMQNLGNKKTSNEEIRVSIVNKGDGVNPFVAEMNFKITLKTWLKHARVQLKKERKEKQLLHHANKDLDTHSNDDDVMPPGIEVEIEVEELHSETSEEDTQQSLSSFRKAGLSGMGSYRDGEGESLQNATPKDKKKIDHIKLLEKRMTAKFKRNSLTKSQTLKIQKSLQSQVAIKKKAIQQRSKSFEQPGSNEDEIQKEESKESIESIV